MLPRLNNRPCPLTENRVTIWRRASLDSWHTSSGAERVGGRIGSIILPPDWVRGPRNRELVFLTVYTIPLPWRPCQDRESFAYLSAPQRAHGQRGRDQS